MKPNVTDPDSPASNALSGYHGAFRKSQHLFCFGQKRSSRGGQLDRSTGALKQGHAQLVLEELYLTAKRRLGHVHALRCASKMQVFRDC